MHNLVNPLYIVQLNKIPEKLHQTQICPEKNVVIINDTVIADKDSDCHGIIRDKWVVFFYVSLITFFLHLYMQSGIVRNHQQGKYSFRVFSVGTV